MRIGAADTERADPGATRLLAAWPVDQAIGDLERAGGEVDFRVRRAVVQGRRNAAVVQHQRGLDEAGNAAGGIQMAEVALDRTEPAGPRCDRLRTEGAAQRRHLDRVAQRRGGAMRLDVADRPDLDAGAVQRLADHRRLAAHAGCAEAGLVAAVVVHPDAADHRVDGVAVGHRLGQPLQHHRRAAGGKQRACGGSIERPAVTVVRLHAAVDRQVTGRLRHHDVDAAGQRQIALPAHQRVPGLGNRHQRGGAGRVQAQRRPGEIEPVGDAGGHVVFFVGQHGGEFAGGLDQIGARLHKLAIAVVGGAGIHADAAGKLLRIDAGILQRVPAKLQKYPLLRVHQQRLARRHAEESRVETVGVVDHAARRHVAWMLAQFARDRRRQLPGGEARDALAAGQQLLPQRVHRGGVGETAGHADDGDAFQWLVHGAVPLRGPNRASAARWRWPRASSTQSVEGALAVSVAAVSSAASFATLGCS